MNLVIILRSYFTDFRDNLALSLTCKDFNNIFKAIYYSEINNYGDKRLDPITNKFSYKDSISLLYKSIADKLNMKKNNIYTLNFEKKYIKNDHNGVYITNYYNNYSPEDVDLKKIRINDIFFRSNLNQTNLSNIIVTKSKFIETSLKSSLSLYSKFINTIFYSSHLTKTEFRDCILTCSSFWRCNMKNIKFISCDLSRCNFQYPILTTNFRTILEGAEITFSNLSYCKFSVIDLPWKENLINNGHETTISYYLQNNYRKYIEKVVFDYINQFWKDKICKNGEKNIEEYCEKKPVAVKIPEKFKDFLSISDPDNGWVWLQNNFFNKHLETKIYNNKPFDSNFKQYVEKIIKINTILFNWILNDLNKCTLNILREIILQTFINFLRPNLNKINLEGSFIYKSYFAGCDMKNSKLVNVNVLKIDKEEEKDKKQNRATDSLCSVSFTPFVKYNCVFIKADLSNSNMSHSNFTSTVFSESNISNSKCINTVFNKSLFYNAKIENTDFSYSKFIEANFHFANLSNCNFTGADLTGADFTGADLTGADFTNAILDKTILKFLFDGTQHEILAPDFNFEHRGLAGHQVPAGEPIMVNTIDLEIKLDGASGLNNLQNRGAVMKHSSGCLYKWNENYTSLGSCVLCNIKK